MRTIRTQRHESGRSTKSRPHDSVPTQHGVSDRDHAPRGMQRRDDSTLEGVKGGPRWTEMASWTQTSVEGGLGERTLAEH